MDSPRAYALPELPSRARPRLEHHGFREQGTAAAVERLERLREKVVSLHEAERGVHEEARGRWIDAFTDIRDAEEVQREAEQELRPDKDLVALQGRAARLFAEVQWELRSAMVRCGMSIVTKASRMGGLVPDESFQDYMERLSREERGLKRVLLETTVGNTEDSQQRGAVGGDHSPSSQAYASTQGEESDEDAEQSDTEQNSPRKRDDKAMKDRQIEEMVAGLERKIKLLQLFRQTVVSLAGGQPHSAHGPGSGLDDGSLAKEDHDSRREDRRRREERGLELEELRRDIKESLAILRQRGSSRLLRSKIRSFQRPKTHTSWLENYLQMNLATSQDHGHQENARQLLSALTEKLVNDIVTLEAHVEALQALILKAKLLPHLRRVIETERYLEDDWVHPCRLRGPLSITDLSARSMPFSPAPVPQGTYEKLSENEFRILIVEPSPEQYYPLICTLESWSMGHQPPSSSHSYAALSYSWGPGACNGRIYMLRHDHGLNLAEPDEWGFAAKMATGIRIRNNLFRALLRLRRHGTGAKPVALWVDSICINQEDPEEKTVQLPRMVEIYSRASNVCIWLGEGDDEGRSDRAMAFITDIMDFAVLDRYAHDKKQAEKWYALSELMRDRWFSRRWVVQEIALAKDATVHCGGSVVRWSDFSDAVSLLVSNQETIRSLFGFSEWREGRNTLGDVGSFGAAILLEATSNLFLRKADGNVKRPIKTVEALVTSLTTFDASDPRDLIYSVVAIASDTSHLVWDTSPDPAAPFVLRANYDQSALDAYKTFTLFCILKSKSLDIICRPWAMPLRDSAGRTRRMPSWIPLLSESEFGAPEEIYSGRKNGEVLVGAAGSPTYRASGNRKNSMDAGTGDVRFLPGGKEGILSAKGLRLGRIRQVSQRITGGVIFYESLRMLGWRGFGRGNGDVPGSVWRTLVADRGRDGRMAPPWYQRACLRCLEVADRFNDGDLNIGELLQGHSQMLREYLIRVRNVTWNRRFFVAEHWETDEPMYGLCPPGTKLGDTVCILFGCSVPVIFRLASDGHVMLLGEAYVHGKMDGEAVEDLQENETWQAEDFKIM